MLFVRQLSLLATLCVAATVAQQNDLLLQNHDSHYDHQLRATSRELQVIACNSDAECQTGSQYCSAGVCRDVGTCTGLLDCQNPSNGFMRKECVGFVTCTAEQKCEYRCNNGNSCDQLARADCLSTPCQMKTCDEPHVSCVDDFCGRCDAIFISASGHQVCQVAFGEDQVCESDSQCDVDEEYCSRGECIPRGFCRGWTDCQNPDNDFLRNVTIPCANGYKECNRNNNRCEFFCTETGCPPNVNAVACVADPCTTTSCDVPFEHCFTDNCGSCKAIFITESGQQVCVAPEHREPEPEPVPVPQPVPAPQPEPEVEAFQTCTFDVCDNVNGFTAKFQCFFDVLECYSKLLG